MTLPEGALVQAGRLGRDLHLDADVVVVGSGAGGAVVAAELAEAGQRVVVVEEGPSIPAEQYARFRPSESMRHLFRDGGMTFAVGLRDTPMINVTMGRVVGGSSVITGAVCFRTPGRVLAHWSRELGLAELTERGLEPAFEAVERAVHVETVPEAMRSGSTRLFARGAERLGRPLLPTRRNTRGCNGCGRCNFGCPHGAKLSVDVTYLPRALAAGARIVSDCRADTIRIEGGRACGVAGTIRGGEGGARRRFEVRARRVVVAAGSYHSPGLLQRSGVGRRSGQVGKNLTLHPGFRVMAAADEVLDGHKGALQSAYSDAFEHEDITLVGLFLPPGVMAATMKGIGPAHVARARQLRHLAVFGGMIHDQGGGVVHQRLGRTVATYTMAPRDRARIPRLMRVMAETFFAGGAREVFLPVLGMSAVTADQLRALDLERIPAKRLECSSQHPLGSCRMGRDPASSVVDPSGACWEVDGLYVADGSIVPTSLGVNPQVSIMALATRIAWKLRDRPPR